MRGSHLLPSQLPGEHRSHEAALGTVNLFGMHIFHQSPHCWYSLHQLMEGWKVESTPSQEIQELAVSRYQAGDLTCHSPPLYQLSYPDLTVQIQHSTAPQFSAKFSMTCLYHLNFKLSSFKSKINSINRYYLHAYLQNYKTLHKYCLGKQFCLPKHLMITNFAIFHFPLLQKPS